MRKVTNQPVRTLAPSPPKSNGRDPSDQAEEQNSGPTDRVRLFPVEAAIWMNYTQDGRAMYSASFQRSYKDREGAWKNTTSFGSQDLLVLAEAARAAYHLIERLRKADRENQPSRGSSVRYEEGNGDQPF